MNHSTTASLRKSYSSTIHIHYSTYIFTHESYQDWWTTEKTPISQSYTLTYLPEYMQMTNYSIIKELLTLCANLLHTLSLEDTLLLYTIFTPANLYFNQYIQQIDHKLQSKEIRNDNRPDPSEAHHATLIVKDCFTLWPILYSILSSDTLFNISGKTDFYNWCANHLELTLEQVCKELCKKKDLKQSQLRFLGLDLEEKCYSVYITKITECINKCITNYPIVCFSSTSIPIKQEYTQFLSKEFTFFTIQQTKTNFIYYIKPHTSLFVFDLLLPDRNKISFLSFPTNQTKFTILNGSIQGVDVHYTIQTANFPTKEQLFKRFSSFFRTELLGWNHHPKQPHWIVKGGYGLKALLETKYGKKGIVSTKDIDINIGVRGYSDEERSTLIMNIQEKVNLFIQASGVPFLFKAVLYTFQPKIYFSVEKYNLYALLLIKYNLEDWIDIGFVDYDISPKMIDWNTSQRVGYPIKTSNVYMKEIVGLVYQSNVKGADGFTYKKRNPNTGTMFRRGRKDIERSMLMCEIDPAIYDRYSSYCDYVSGLTEKDFENSQFNFEFLKGLFKK